MPTQHDPLPFSVISARCAASTNPLAWAEAFACAHDLARLMRDARRVSDDVDRLPTNDPLASTMGRHWWQSVLRRRAEADALVDKLDRLQSIAPEVYKDATDYAAELGTRWIVIGDDGSEGDG